MERLLWIQRQDETRDWGQYWITGKWRCQSVPGPINKASSFLFGSVFQFWKHFIYKLVMRCDEWSARSEKWQPGANSGHWVRSVAISLAPSHAQGNDEQIGLIWNFIAALMMTLTRSAEHHQIQIKPDLRSYTLVVIPKNLKNISLVMKLRRQNTGSSISDNGLSTIFGGWSFVKWGGLLIL